MSFRIYRNPQGGLMLRTDWLPLLWLAWGPRRLSSSARRAGLTAYGGEVTATLHLWWQWVKDRPRRMARGPAIVVLNDKEGHGVRYLRELKEADARRAAEEKHSAMLLRLDDLQEQRRKAREARDFETADRLRAEIEAAGIKVGDAKL